MSIANANLGIDLLLADGDLSVSNTGDLQTTPSGRLALLQDIAHLLETLPNELWGHTDYGAGVPRLLGEQGQGIESRVKRAIEDALQFSQALSGRVLSGSVKVVTSILDDTRLEARVYCHAIEDGHISPLNFVWRLGIDEISEIFEI